MALRVGINGFGRMGRLAMRVAWDAHGMDIVHINETGCNAEISAHLLEFDSIHGRWNRAPTAGGNAITVGDSRISYTSEPSPGDVAWDEYGVDLVLECTGAFRTRALLSPYFDRGVKKVLVAAPVKDDAINIVMGINDELYDPNVHDIVTAASCTTNCLAPVVKVIRDGLGIEHGVITTIHNVTNTQTVVDTAHKDPRRARSSLMSLIPTTTGSAKAITMIYPDLVGKLNGIAVRVPLLNASLTDCVFEVKRPTTANEVNALMSAAAEGPLAGVLGYEERPLVSIDYVNDPRSAIIDAGSTMVIDGTQVKVLAWYDNEWGYVHRMVELATLIGRSLG